MKTIGIRREDKNIWEKRVPLIPEHIEEIIGKYDIKFQVQPYKNRAFADSEFEAAGAEIKEDLSDASVVFAVKEIPVDLLQKDKTYVFFSHTIKGQDYNMEMLQKLIDLKCTLIDYELIANEKGQRLVFFGEYAGLAGMIDTLYGIGQRYRNLGYETPFLNIKSAYEYRNLVEAKHAVKVTGDIIRDKGMPEELSPFVIALTGYGKVSQGAQEIFDLLPFKEVEPDELPTLEKNRNLIYKTVFKEEHMVEPQNGNAFDLNEYYNHPERYRSKFEKYIPYFDVMVNCIYWEDKYPRLLTKNYLKTNIDKLKLEVVGDISCDIEGSVEFTVKATESDNPAFVFDPVKETYTDGYEGRGVVNIAVDNLPAEIPEDASRAFSNTLKWFVVDIVNADLTREFDDVNYPPEIKKAVIVYRGELVPEYRYLEEYLK